MSNRIIKFKYDNIRITVRERHNKWYLDFTHNKKRIKRTTGLYSNDENLQHIKDVIVPELIVALTGKQQIEFLKKDDTIKVFAAKFFEVYKGTIREHVYYENESIYKKQIEPIFGDKLLNEIKPMHLESWQNKLLSTYSAHTVVRYRSILNLILNKAFENELIKVNPFTKVKSPLTINKKFKTLDDMESDIYPFNNDEITMILDNTKNNLHYFIYIMLCTGMRPGEIISLTWKDIDFTNKRIAVDKTTKKGKIGNVKTQSSVRYVDIIPTLEDKLKAFFENRQSDIYIFISKYKKPYYSHVIISRRFKKLLKDLNIKERILYNLRHTFASMMISEGYNILWVSKMLGHKDVSITLKVYASYIKENDEKRLDNLIKIVPKFVSK